ncbi:unnamed protein product [Lota lota]
MHGRTCSPSRPAPQVEALSRRSRSRHAVRQLQGNNLVSAFTADAFKDSPDTNELDYFFFERTEPHFDTERRQCVKIYIVDTEQ